LNVVPEADAADFLFPFDQDLHVDGSLPFTFWSDSRAFRWNMNLAFVVGGAAAEEIAVAHGGFEGRSGPEIDGGSRAARHSGRRKGW